MGVKGGAGADDGIRQFRRSRAVDVDGELSGAGAALSESTVHGMDTADQSKAKVDSWSCSTDPRTGTYPPPGL